jgi:hypothetical protein
MRLCELHRYEAGRRAPLAEEVYRANANMMMQVGSPPPPWIWVVLRGLGHRI